MSEISTPRRKRITAPDLISLKAANKRIVAVTVYDYPSALIVESAEIDIALVGDSVAIVLGYQNTLPVTIEEMLHHLKAVRRGLRTPLLVVDMPFGSYQCGTDQAVASAVRLIKEGGAQVVKLEGGKPVLEIVRKLTSHGIPVMGHLGLTPQSVNQFGGHKVQGNDSGFLKRFGIHKHLVCITCVFALDFVTAKLIHRLWGQA